MKEKKTIEELEEVELAKVLARLDFDRNNDYLREKALSLLRSGMIEQAVASVWRNLSDEQAVHLQDFIAQSAVVSPEIASNMVVLDFADLYPDLREKISADLTEYFDDFVEDFNRF